MRPDPVIHGPCSLFALIYRTWLFKQHPLNIFSIRLSIYLLFFTMIHGFNPFLLLNTFIDNRSIQLVSILGVGSFGVVYLGVHVRTGRRYAVKLLLYKKPEMVEREIELHSRVSGHPAYS